MTREKKLQSNLSHLHRYRPRNAMHCTKIIRVKHQSFLIITIFLFLVAYEGVSSCESLSIEPGHTQLLVGSELVLTCKVIKPPVKVSEVYFQFFDKPLMPNNENEIRQLDSFTSELRIKNTSLHNSGRYYCKSKDYLCSSSVDIRYANSYVENFKCVYIFQDKLVCTWSKPDNTFSSAKYYLTEVKKGYIPEGCTNSCSGKPCNVRCELIPGKKSAQKFSFKLTITDFNGEMYDQSFNFDQAEIVKLQMPTNLKYNSDKNELRWTIDNDVLSYEVSHHNWKTRVVARQQDKIIKMVEMEIIASSFQLSSLGLLSNTEYNISVSIKERNDKNKYWSDIVHHNLVKNYKYNEILLKTPKTIPSMPPNMTTGSFEVNVNRNGTREVTLFWTNVNETDFNGDNFTYQIAYQQLDPGEPVWDTRESVKTHFQFIDLELGVEYEFRLYSKNEIGLSANYSKLVVKKQSELLPKVQNVGVIRRGKNDQDEVLWFSPSSIDNFTIFWCRRRANGCEGELEWAKAKGNTTLRLPDGDIIFGVSANGDNAISSGIEWAEAVCVIDLDSSDKKKASKLRLNRLKSNRVDNLKVGITDVCLSHRKAVIKSFWVEYCDLDAKPSPKCHIKSIEDPWAESFVLERLKASAEYQIKVEAIDHDDRPRAAGEIVTYAGLLEANRRTLIKSVELNGPKNFTIKVIAKSATRSNADYFRINYKSQGFNCSIKDACQDDPIVEEDVDKLTKMMTCECLTYFDSEPLKTDTLLLTCKLDGKCWSDAISIINTDGAKNRWQMILMVLVFILSIMLIGIASYLRIKYLRRLKEKAKAFHIPTMADRRLSVGELNPNTGNLYGVYNHDELNGLIGLESSRFSLSGSKDFEVDSIGIFGRSGSAGSKSSKTALLGKENPAEGEGKKPTELKTFRSEIANIKTGPFANGTYGLRQDYNAPNYLNDSSNGTMVVPPLATSTPKVVSSIVSTNVTGAYVSPQQFIESSNHHLKANGQAVSGLNGATFRASTLV